jgi:uncharacterized membrane protein
VKTYRDAHLRSILKALSWRICATLTTVFIVFAFTHQLALSVGIGSVEVVTKLILYYFHERIWGFVGIGTRKHPLSVLPVERSLDETDLETIKNKLKDLGYICEN